MKVHKVTLLVIDHNDVGADDVATTLENTNYPADCISPRVVSVETAEVAWQDDDPLNHRQAHREAFAALFGKQPLAWATSQPTLSVKELKDQLTQLPDTAEISPVWANGPPGDADPAVELHGFQVADGVLQVLVDIRYLDEFNAECDEKDDA